MFVVMKNSIPYVSTNSNNVAFNHAMNILQSEYSGNKREQALDILFNTYNINPDNYGSFNVEVMYVEKG